MQIEFHGAADTVTGSAHLLRAAGRAILIDCGMYQGSAALEKRNFQRFLFRPRELAAVLVTHAHIDHCGLLPKLVRDGFAGPIHATGATADLMRLLLLDAAHIAQADAERLNRKAARAGQPLQKPLYTPEEAEAALTHITTHRYDEEVEIAPGILVKYRDAGHILGSAFLELTIRENGALRRVTFSGDVGSLDQAIIRDPAPASATEALVIESTYGDRVHKSKPDTLKELAEILQQAWRDRGNVIIPAFAVGRTQEILYRLRELADEGRLPGFQVYVDSPLAISVTEVVRSNPQCYDDETIHEIIGLGHDPLVVPNLHFTREAQASIGINDVKEPSLIISANGMCSAGRILHHLKHNLWRREAHVVIVGFQAEGALGRLLVDGAPRVKIMGETIAVAAQIHTLGGLSAHADQPGLLNWMAPAMTAATRVFVVHGEKNAAEAFAGAVRRRFGNRPSAPHWHETVDLRS